jgi:hypothetical protein
MQLLAAVDEKPGLGRRRGGHALHHFTEPRVTTVEGADAAGESGAAGGRWT